MPPLGTTPAAGGGLLITGHDSQILEEQTPVLELPAVTNACLEDIPVGPHVPCSVTQAELVGSHVLLDSGKESSDAAVHP